MAVAEKTKPKAAKAPAAKVEPKASQKARGLATRIVKKFDMDLTEAEERDLGLMLDKELTKVASG